MANSFFKFKQFNIHQEDCAMKVCTDACLFGAWCAAEMDATANASLLDIGTGTGLLSLMILQQHQIKIDAVEIDALAATQAQQNIDLTHWRENVMVWNADILEMDFSKKFDYIICNPPFYENDLQSPDSKRNLAHHSRHLTLTALSSIIEKNLKQEGTFFLLLPYKRRAEAVSLLNNIGLFVHKEVCVRHTEHHAPFRIMLKCGFQNAVGEISVFTISEDANQYTPEFTELLKPYYLKL